jgi:hypothetical protein
MQCQCFPSLDLGAVVYSKPGPSDVNDKELNRHFIELNARITEIGNAKSGEPLVGSPFDRKLDSISEKLNEVSEDVVKLKEKVSNHIKFFWCMVGALALWCAWLSTSLYTVHGEISGFRAPLYTANLRLDASAPAKAENIAGATKTLQEAKKSKVRISLPVIQESGQDFIKASQENAESWKAATSFINYPSFLNVDYQPTLSGQRQMDNPQIKFTVQVKSGPNATEPSTLFQGQILPFGTASPENSARYEAIDSMQPPTGVAFVLIRHTGKDNVIVLDGLRLKNVVIADSTVEYDGGPLILENVYFVNCTFTLPAAHNTRALGNAILESASVQFDSATIPPA